MRTSRIYNVVLPVGLENPAMSFEITLVGGDAVGATEYGKKIRQQVDQHSTGKLPARGRRKTRHTDGCAESGRVGRGMIVATLRSNKRRNAMCFDRADAMGGWYGESRRRPEPVRSRER